MARAPDPEERLGNLCSAIQKARQQLEWFRAIRVKMVKQTLGGWWSPDAAEKPTPINLMAMYQQIVGGKLIPKNPRVMLSTFEKEHKPAVSIMEQWANDEIENINLANSLRRIVTDALYCIGIAKVGIATPADAESQGWTLGVGEPFIERVDLDDFVFDIHAKDLSEAGYIGNRFRVPLRLVKSSGLYGKRGDITGNPDRLFNNEGDERIGMLGRGYNSDDEDYEEFIDLWEIWLRREGRVITLTDDDLSGGADEYHGKGRRRCLRDVKWIGPASGPYHFLSLEMVAGNAIGKGPIQNIYDLHLAINNITRKLIRQCQDTKKITMVSGGKSEDGKRVNDTPDGHACAVDDPKSIVQVNMNEPNQPLALLLEAFIKHCSAQAGNLELLGGLGPQARTLGQDKLNEASSSATIGTMQTDTMDFVASVLKSWLWFHHHHPFKVHTTEYHAPGFDEYPIVRRSFPDNPKVHKNTPGLTVRSGDFEAMRIKIDPYSMVHQTPETRAQKLLDAVMKIYLPMAQLAQQQGVALDLNVFFEKLGHYWDDPDLAEIFSFAEKPPEEGGDAPAAPGAPGVTAPGDSGDPKEYIRRSLGADSQQAKEAMGSNMMAKAVGQNGQVQQIGGR